jgi:hypothetical protein
VKFDVLFHTEACTGEPWTESFDEPYVSDMFEANEYMIKCLDYFNSRAHNKFRRRILTISTEAYDATLAR